MDKVCYNWPVIQQFRHTQSGGGGVAVQGAGMIVGALSVEHDS